MIEQGDGTERGGGEVEGESKTNRKIEPLFPHLC